MRNTKQMVKIKLSVSSRLKLLQIILEGNYKFANLPKLSQNTIATCNLMTKKF